MRGGKDGRTRGSQPDPFQPSLASPRCNSAAAVEAPQVSGRVLFPGAGPQNPEFSTFMEGDVPGPRKAAWQVLLQECGWVHPWPQQCLPPQSHYLSFSQHPETRGNGRRGHRDAPQRGFALLRAVCPHAPPPSSLAVSCQHAAGCWSRCSAVGGYWSQQGSLKIRQSPGSSFTATCRGRESQTWRNTLHSSPRKVGVVGGLE